MPQFAYGSKSSSMSGHLILCLDFWSEWSVCSFMRKSLPFYLDSGSEWSVCRFLILYCQAQPKLIITSVSYYSILTDEYTYLKQSVSRLHDFPLSHTKMWCSWTDVGLSGVRKGILHFFVNVKRTKFFMCV